MRIFFGGDDSGAVFSDDRVYRHSLWRRWESGCPPERMVAFCGLNPSKADEVDNDPTVKRWIAFAKSWGFGGMFVVNAFDLCETYADVMKEHSEPLSLVNDEAIRQISSVAKQFVCCWGAHGGHRNRSSIVRHLLRDRDIYYLRLTKYKQPEHVLYLPGKLTPILWKRADNDKSGTPDTLPTGTDQALTGVSESR